MLFYFIIFFWIILLIITTSIIFARVTSTNIIMFYFYIYGNFVYLLILKLEYLAAFLLIIYGGSVIVLYLFMLMNLDLNYVYMNKNITIYNILLSSCCLISFFFSFIFLNMNEYFIKKLYNNFFNFVNFDELSNIGIFYINEGLYILIIIMLLLLQALFILIIVLAPFFFKKMSINYY